MKNKLPVDFVVARGQTQKNVNRTILAGLVASFAPTQPLAVLDVPCGKLEFLGYVARLFPAAALTGADIATPPPAAEGPAIAFVAMDLTREFSLPAAAQFDLITSISGVMMFGNTLSFVRNCTARLKPGGTFVLTNDNSGTIMDRLAYLFLARYRLFKPFYEDAEALTQLVPVQELCRLLRTHGVEITRIEYTSFYWKDLLYLPVALVAYAAQQLYLRRLPTQLPARLTRQLYPFRQLFCKHYIITGHKK